MVIRVIRPFRDKNNPKVTVAAGTVINDFDDVRASSLVLRGLAVLVETEEKKTVENVPPASPPKQPENSGSGDGLTGNVTDESVTDIDLTGHHFKVIADVKKITDAEKLKSALEEENKSVKPRQAVVDAIKNRIDELGF
jgi:hypothetical protein